MAKTLFDKLWDSHQIALLPDEVSLLHVDRHLVHELTGVGAIEYLESQGGVQVRNPELTFATIDHVISTDPDHVSGGEAWNQGMMTTLRQQARRHGIECLDVADGRQGIVHVTAPEQGLTLPGALLVCGDSHACTHGAFGALAWGIGFSELVHVFATQTIRQCRPKTMHIRFRGRPRAGVGAKDLILYVIGRFGSSAGNGYAVEFSGQFVRELGMEGRMTLCNLSIELGAKIGLIAPDQTTFSYLKGRPWAPQGEGFDQARVYWETLHSDPDAVFDLELDVDVTAVGPQVTWGTSPEHVMEVGATVPDPGFECDPVRRTQLKKALAYMGLSAGQSLEEVAIDRVFIGSCTNGRLSDLRTAAQIVEGQRIAPGVTGWVVPGSLQVKRQAEAEGLDQIFRAAGFDWRAPGCSMCVGVNGERVAPGERCVSTSNRNFEGRQGPGALTHLAGPAVAAASAIAGVIVAPETVGRSL